MEIPSVAPWRGVDEFEERCTCHDKSGRLVVSLAPMRSEQLSQYWSVTCTCTFWPSPCRKILVKSVVLVQMSR